jgi:large subunit ribosomal protein L28
MAVCDFTGKKTSSGNNVSHSVRRTKRRFRANIQNKKLNVNGQNIKFKVSTQALRTLVKPTREMREVLKSIQK